LWAGITHRAHPAQSIANKAADTAANTAADKAANNSFSNITTRNSSAQATG
jgi:hypothetical protein